MLQYKTIKTDKFSFSVSCYTYSQYLRGNMTSFKAVSFSSSTYWNVSPVLSCVYYICTLPTSHDTLIINQLCSKLNACKGGEGIPDTVLPIYERMRDLSGAAEEPWTDQGS